MEEVLDLVTNLNLGTVTDELIHSSPLADVVFKGINKLLITLHPVTSSTSLSLPTKTCAHEAPSAMAGALE